MLRFVGPRWTLPVVGAVFVPMLVGLLVMRIQSPGLYEENRRWVMAALSIVLIGFLAYVVLRFGGVVALHDSRPVTKSELELLRANEELG